MLLNSNVAADYLGKIILASDQNPIYLGSYMVICYEGDTNKLKLRIPNIVSIHDKWQEQAIQLYFE